MVSRRRSLHSGARASSAATLVGLLLACLLLRRTSAFVSRPATGLGKAPGDQDDQCSGISRLSPCSRRRATSSDDMDPDEEWDGPYLDDLRNGWINGYTKVKESDGAADRPHRYSYSDMLEERGTWFHKVFSRRSAGGRIYDKEENEDGWGEMRKKRRPMVARVLRGGLKSVRDRVFSDSAGGETGTLILVRHGESIWNANKTFTGWADVDLSERGHREVEHAARLLLEGGYDIDVVFTSRLKRAIRSVWIILQELNRVYLPVFKSWRLNERHYGALTGLSKTETAARLGRELVQNWRGSLYSRPPALKRSDPYWPGKDRKYADLSADQIPLTESLLDCMERTKPLWDQKIMYELQNGRNVLILGHGNTLRGLVKLIDNISDNDIQEVAIPTGIPIIYKFDKDLKPIPPGGDRQTASQVHMKGIFLEKPGLLNEALKREEAWRKQVPGYQGTMELTKTPMSTLERSLYKLQASRELGEWAGKSFDATAPEEDDGNDGNFGRPIQFEDEVWELGMQELGSGPTIVNGDAAASMLSEDDEDDVKPISIPLYSSSPCVASFPSEAVVPGLGEVPVRRDAVVVIIRHGKTEHNKLGLFTGWEDAPLAKDGIDEAREAGRLLKAHGFEFDVVYSSWLSRSIETALYILDELDSLWLPMIKTWRLNERHYGDLTGLSKQMVKQRHGESQFKAWRRGYSTRPPEVSSFSQHYPGNDPRYQKYLNDIRFSVTESVIRSIEAGKPVVHRKLPKTESLKDCMERTIPFYTERIVPEALAQGKRVLISSSENAIRGLLMHLCDIPEDKVTELEIPNGLPIIFDLQSKCVKLLEDGTGRDPLEVYNFGKAASYLFRPCQNEDGSPDEECEIRFRPEYDVEISEQDRKTLEAITRPREPAAAAAPAA